MRFDASGIRSLQYFWETKDDLERYAGWEGMQPLLQAKYPELLQAWSNYKSARAILSAVVRDVTQRAEHEEWKSSQ